MRVLITGTDGVVGREIVNEFKKYKNYNLLELTNKKKIIKNNKVIYQDLTKKINLTIKVDAIIHCAAKHPFSKKGNDNINIYSTNVKMTKNLIKFANDNNVKKMIFLSSTDVYGLIKNDVVFENQKPLESNSYGKSKFFSEQLFCKKDNKFKAVCLRIPSVLTFNLSKNNPLIIKIIKKIMNNEKVFSYNLNKKFNNILDVKEIVKLINVILKKKKLENEIYNFSASYPIKFVNMINLMIKLLKSKSEIISIMPKKKSFIISNKKLSDHFNYDIASINKIIIRSCQKLKKLNYIN